MNFTRYRISLIFIAVVITAFIIVYNLNIYSFRQQIKDIKQELMIKDFKANKSKLINLLTVHEAFDEKGALELIRHGSRHDGGYIIPTKAFEKADALLGYGIDTDNTFETQFSKQYNKPSFGFDCSIDSINTDTPLFTFIDECIGTYSGSGSSNVKLTTFTEELKNLKLEDKKVFVKMDIEGAEYDALQEVIENHQKVTGIVLEIHFSARNIQKPITLLEKLQENFVLVHLHANNCVRGYKFSANNLQGMMPYVMELTLIHKSLIKDHRIAVDQSFPKAFDSPNCSNAPDIKFTIQT